jgi:hypothetical protein
MSTVFTATVTSSSVPGASYLRGAKLVGPTSYSTGGVPVTASLFNLSVLDHVIIQGVTGAFLDANWDDVNKKIILSYPTGGATAPASLSAPAATSTPASGATAVTSSAAQPAIPVTFVAGLGKEVAASTDVSSVTVKVLVFGR